MNVALDLGTHAGRSLRREQDELIRRKCRSLALLVPADGRAQAWLERSRIPFIPGDNHFAVLGDAAAELSHLFPVGCADLLPDGLIAHEDLVSRQLVALLIDSLLPPVRSAGELCGFTQPGYDPDHADFDEPLQRRFEFVARVIRLRGYEPLPINPAAALVLAEMEREMFTGIGVSLGASGCDLAAARNGSVLATVRIPRGGRWIDEQLARYAGRHCLDAFGRSMLDLEWGRRRKESMSLIAGGEAEELIVANACNEILADIAEGIEQLLAQSRPAFALRQGLSIVMAGGPTQLPGFEERARESLTGRLAEKFRPRIRVAAGGESALARGCLIHAALESESRVAATRISA